MTNYHIRYAIPLSFPFITILSLLFSPLVLAGQQTTLEFREIKLITVDGLQFKDLNRDGKLNPYEDWRLSAAQRTADLVSRMTLAEKAGVMMHGSAPTAGSVTGAGTTYDFVAAKEMIVGKHVNSFITRLSGEKPAQMAEENNQLQQIAENTRLGIPITISTDPRNSFQYLTGATVASGKFSKWPETLGIAAIGDETLARHYADIIRQEYRAVGITEALSPQADLATEPRWPRINGTFGEDPALTKKMVRGYITGMQNGENGLNDQSVISIVKHWVGYGAAQDGWDSHNAYGKYAVFSKNNLQQHIEPFTGAFEAHVAGVMPTYSILKHATWRGKKIAPLGAGFNRFLLTDLLRGQYGFNGVILSDWLITQDCKADCINGFKPGEKPVPRGMPWGVEHMTVDQRFIQAVKAGIDQFGGVTDSTVLIRAVQNGKLTASRLDESVVRILKQKFQTGLFERPYVNAQQANQIVGNPEWQQQADNAQARSLVLLQNHHLLPLHKGQKIWLYGVEKQAAQNAGFMVVAEPENAEIALIRTQAPYEQPHQNYYFGAKHHEGSLAFNANNPDYRVIASVSAKVPTVVTVYLDRPAILSNIVNKTQAIIANFGVSDDVLLSKLTSTNAFTGKLPFELPSSMSAVRKQHADLPYDSKNALFPFGFGLEH
ncbi:glycoside hydrolase family 3 N-terminal domain-containing protein [Prodigiosinella aquatilis]|nr:glycoside hydrolase family 3 N-terminal domain-containing protein [Prodigiosinella sp. LS101]WJV52214.1 glycoside hydrolase family 3 N-terminal domain-containing protein [Prodigiosinella sp. LS101]WJV56570.1 glycoside hydrolase family 3 N-terminal domain-containing protein [Pectobacteriaceae bacterium C111]